MISRKEINHISGEEYDKHFKEAEMFVERMKKFLENRK